MDQPVCGERIGHHQVIKAVVQADAGSLGRDVLQHPGHLGGIHALDLAQVLDLRALKAFRQAGIQLVAAPADLHFRSVIEAGQGSLKAPLANETPGASDIGPDFYQHMRRQQRSAGFLFPASGHRSVFGPAVT